MLSCRAVVCFAFRFQSIPCFSQFTFVPESDIVEETHLAKATDHTSTMSGLAMDVTVTEGLFGEFEIDVSTFH